MKKLWGIGACLSCKVVQQLKIKGMCLNCYMRERRRVTKGRPIKHRGPHPTLDYKCSDCKYKFSSKTKLLDIVCPNCESIHIERDI